LPSETITDAHERRNKLLLTGLVKIEEEQFHWQSEKAALIQQTVKELRPQGKLADIGCFTGIATQRYSPGFDQVVGFDTCREALERAESRNIEPRYWSGGAERCPASDEEFDFIVAADVIEHTVDTDSFIEELRRVLRPDGRLIVATPNLGFWISRLRLLRGKTPWSYPGPSATIKGDLMVDLNHIRVTTRPEWQTFFEQHSLRVQSVRGWSILHAMGDSLSIKLARSIDRWMTRQPDAAFGLLFVLTKGNQGTSFHRP
jgi:SAM-dependent methyltransferase